MTVPPSLGPLLRAELDGVVEAVVAAVGQEVPLYRRPIRGSFGAGLRLGVTQALGRFTDVVAGGGVAGGQGDAAWAGLEIYRALGRGEVRQGRPLEALLSAYRVGARVSWRSFAEIATRAEAGSDALVALAELVFAYIDELSAASAQGYAAEQSLLAGARDRARGRLAALLLQGGVDRTALADAAGLAGWQLPATVAAVLAPAATPLAARLGPEALVIESDDEVLALVPDPAGPGRVEALRRSLQGTGAVLGPVVEPAGAGDSLARARRAAALRRRLQVGPGDVVVADGHRLLLLLHADPQLLAELADDLLGGLAGETAASRERLEATLLAWLAHRGERARAAAELHVHPQTVRYRLTRLRELLGGVLDDPDTRFALELVLRARSGGPATPQPPQPRPQPPPR